MALVCLFLIGLLCVSEIVLLSRLNKVENELADIRQTMEEEVEQEILNKPVWDDEDFANQSQEECGNCSHKGCCHDHEENE